jgi:8-amino-7-oxononanoate synthase
MDFLHTALQQLEQENLYRRLVDYTPQDAVHADIEDRQYLMMAANNYLGLTHHPAVRQAAAAASLTYGTGSGGSRLTTGNHLFYRQLELQLAAFKGTEAALVFNTGYMANVGTISALAEQGDVIFSDELNHASIIDGCRLSRAKAVVYGHSNMDQLASLLTNTPCSGRRFIITDGVFSMDGDIARLADIVQLAQKANAFVMVDDAHATGVIGPGGRGTAAHFGLEGQVHISMGTLSKSLGSEGGYVAGSQLLIDYLVNKARSFIFSTALAPATVAAALAALNHLSAKPDMVEKLAANAQYLRTELNMAGFDTCGSTTAIVPVLVGDAALTVEFARLLRDEGILVSAIRPPTVPVGSSRLRITVSAAHSQVELTEASKAICTIGRRLGVI